MIKNIVFDMGKVLLDYDSDRVCRHFVKEEKARHAVQTSVFFSPEWLMLDMGLLSEKTALIQIQTRLKTDYEKSMAELCLRHWHEFNMWPIRGMEELVCLLKSQGYGIYLCSNASLRLLECSDIIPGAKYFDGMLFSAEVQCMKPQKEMYQHFFKRFSLNPQECFFIDDLQMNIDGARAQGMDGYCFCNRDAGQLKQILSSRLERDLNNCE